MKKNEGCCWLWKCWHQLTNGHLNSRACGIARPCCLQPQELPELPKSKSQTRRCSSPVGPCTQPGPNLVTRRHIFSFRARALNLLPSVLAAVERAQDPAVSRIRLPGKFLRPAGCRPLSHSWAPWRKMKVVAPTGAQPTHSQSELSSPGWLPPHVSSINQLLSLGTRMTPPYHSLCTLHPITQCQPPCCPLHSPCHPIPERHHSGLQFHLQREKELTPSLISNKYLQGPGTLLSPEWGGRERGALSS